ncbi:TPA: hypothetical protein ACIAID_004466, partial [Enterobacter hormaechei subsp. steigerwaltii]
GMAVHFADPDCRKNAVPITAPGLSTRCAGQARTFLLQHNVTTAILYIITVYGGAQWLLKQNLLSYEKVKKK